MLWLHQLQQRLAITRREALALFSILSLFLAGLAIQFIQRQNVPPLNRPALFADTVASPDTRASIDSLQAPPLAHGQSIDLRTSGLRTSGLRASGLRASGPQTADRESPDAAGDGVGGRLGDLIDLNKATSAELQDLRGIGPSLAGRIVAYRDATPFQSVDQLTDVRGIGPKTLARIRPRLTVSP